MKKIAAFIICAMSFHLHAQKYTLTWGQMLPNENKSNIMFTDRSPAAPFFSICQSQHLAYVTPLSTYSLFKVDDKLSSILQKDLQSEDKNTALHVVGIENTGKHLLYFYSITKDHVITYNVDAIDYNGNVLSTTPLFSYPGKEYDDYGTATVTVDPARSKFLLCSRKEIYAANPVSAAKVFTAVCDMDGKSCGANR